MRYAVAVVVFLLISASAVGTVAGQESPDLDGPADTTFNVLLEADGDARWVVEMRFTLDTDDERTAFEEYGDAFEAGEAPAGPGVEFFRAAAASASQVADREMRIVEVSRDSAVRNETGTLELAFTWTAFLGQTANGYVLQDALRTGDGSWLESLEAGQELRIRTPPGYEILRSGEARQENESLVIAGPESFDTEGPVVEYEGTGPGSEETPNGGTDWGVVATGLLGLLFVVVVMVVVWRWRGTEPVLLAARDSESEDGEPAAGPPTEEPDRESEAELDTDETAEPATDPELLSDEERVEQLLEHNGGRMRQADIVAETDWSDAKVSQLLSRMAEEGRVEKLRLGRENVISLPDEPE